MIDHLFGFLVAVVTRSDLWLIVGLLLAWLTARRLVRGTGVSAHQIDGLVGCCLVAVFALLLTVTLARDGMAGARPWTYWLRPRGDVAVAFVALVATTLLYARGRRIPCATLADAGTPGVLLLLVCARLGCFMRGCCWGDLCVDPAVLGQQLDAATLARVHSVPWLCTTNWPLAVTFPRGSPAYLDQVFMGLMPQPALHSLPCHPVQLYEATLTAVLAVVLLWCYPRRRFPWRVASVGLGGYAVIRFGFEFLRADHPAVWQGLTFVQIISAFCAATAVVWYWAAARRTRCSAAQR
jgi:prolipoprotein diacylglyceryltransferase